MAAPEQKPDSTTRAVPPAQSVLGRGLVQTEVAQMLLGRVER